MNAKEWAGIGSDLAAATKVYVERVRGELFTNQRAHEIQIELLEAELLEMRERLRALEAERMRDEVSR